MKKILDYIKKQLEAGHKEEEIISVLVKSGYNMQEMKQIISSIKGESNKNKFFTTKKKLMKNTLIITAILIILIIFFIFIFQNLIKGPMESKSAVEFRSLINTAWETKDSSACSKASNNKEYIVCKVYSIVASKNESLCQEKLENALNFTFKADENSQPLWLTPNDYCWMLMSKIKNMDYCKNIEARNARETCTGILNKET